MGIAFPSFRGFEDITFSSLCSFSFERCGWRMRVRAAPYVETVTKSWSLTCDHAYSFDPGISCEPRTEQRIRVQCISNDFCSGSCEIGGVGRGATRHDCRVCRCRLPSSAPRQEGFRATLNAGAIYYVVDCGTLHHEGFYAVPQSCAAGLHAFSQKVFLAPMQSDLLSRRSGNLLTLHVGEAAMMGLLI